jgi:hypothetical protein
MWKNLRDKNTKIIRRRKDALSMKNNSGKNTDTHSDYVIHIAFPRQQWLRERASLLRYTYSVCPVLSHNMCVRAEHQTHNLIHQF